MILNDKQANKNQNKQTKINNNINKTAQYYFN